MSYGNGIKLTAGFDVGAKTPLDSKSVVQTIAERDAFVTDNLVYEGLEVYVKDTGHKYRYNGTSWIDLDTQSGSESGTGEGLTTEQINQLTSAYEHSQTPHVSADDIPTNISDLTNDSGFITSIPSEYITEAELEAKGYLTEHQSLTDYAKKTDIPDVSDFLTEVPAGYVTDTKLSTELDKKVNKEVGKGLSTNDLTNELVTKINSSATEAFVTNAIANAQLGSGEVDLSGYATVDALNLKADLTHTHDQYLTKVPDEYITETELNAKGYLTEHQDISNLALKSEIPDVSSFITSDDLPTVPTKVSDLENDSNFITSIPEEYITETELNAKGYLTSHQDISGLQPKTDNSLTTTDKTVVGAINELKTNMSNINTGGGSSFSGSYNDLTDKPTIPTKTSDLNNDSSFIGYPDVIVIDKGDMYTELDLDNDIPLGTNTILLTGSVVYHAFEHELVSVFRDVNSPDGFSIYTLRGNRVSVSKSNGNWSITSSTSFIYSDSAKVLYQRITDDTLTTTAKTVPTAINELKSGLDGIKVPINISELNNDSGYLTSHQDISNLQPKTDDSLATSDKTVIGAINEVKLSIPTKVSDLANDKNYISSIPSEYVTETELNAKGYLTSHQDISGLQSKTDNNLTTTSKEVVGAINEVKDKADLILDTEVRLDKTYSSSKIYSDIQDAIDSSKSFTLSEIGKMSGASYKVVTSTAEMTDGKIIYLLENDATYDMYIVETAGTVTKIGDTAIDLSSYLKATDAESAYLKKTTATSTYATQTSFNNHITDTVAHLTQFEKNKLLTTDNITSTINNNSDNTQIPSAKATYDLANKKANTNHTHIISDIKGLSIPTKVGELTNDAGYISEVIDTLTSTDTDKPLSAKQGKVLKDKVDLKANDSEVVKKTDIATTIGLSSTDKQVASALLTKTELDKVNASLGELSDSLVDKQDFRVFKSLEEFNEKKGTSFTVVNGIDNMKDIVNAMSNGEMLIITIAYVSHSDVYFGLDASTGWAKAFTLIKANGLCDVECRTTAPSTLKRILNTDGVIGDWQELATMDKVALKHECFDKKVTLTDSNWKYKKLTFEKNYNNTPSINVSCGDYLNPDFYSYWGCEAYIINMNNKGCTIRYRSSKASESDPLEFNIIVFVNGI